MTIAVKKFANWFMAPTTSEKSTWSLIISQDYLKMFKTERYSDIQMDYLEVGANIERSIL